MMASTARREAVHQPILNNVPASISKFRMPRSRYSSIIPRSRRTRRGLADDSVRSWPSKNVSTDAMTPTWCAMPSRRGLGQHDGQERIGDGRELRWGDVVGGTLVGSAADAITTDPARPRAGSTPTSRPG